MLRRTDGSLDTRTVRIVSVVAAGLFFQQVSRCQLQTTMMRIPYCTDGGGKKSDYSDSAQGLTHAAEAHKRKRH